MGTALSCGPQGTAEGGENRPTHHKDSTSCHRGRPEEAMSTNGHVAFLRTPLILDILFFKLLPSRKPSRTGDRRRMDRLVRRRASSVLGCPLDSVEVVGNGRMMAKLSSLLNNTSHPLQDTLTALGSSFSERLLHPRLCEGE
ncbi:hypothetical protein L3Q82_014368, partial [Scortum barcoo]